MSRAPGEGRVPGKGVGTSRAPGEGVGVVVSRALGKGHQ
jgi:hypothetical protein